MSFFKSLARASLVASDLEDVIAVEMPTCFPGRTGQFGRMFEVVCDAAVDFSGALAWRVV